MIGPLIILILLLAIMLIPAWLTMWIGQRRLAKRLANIRQLEELVAKMGRVKLKEASEAIGMDVANVKALLSELIREGKVRGIFTSDGEGFVTEQKLEEEIRRGLE